MAQKLFCTAFAFIFAGVLYHSGLFNIHAMESNNGNYDNIQALEPSNGNYEYLSNIFDSMDKNTKEWVIKQWINSENLFLENWRLSLQDYPCDDLKKRYDERKKMIEEISEEKNNDINNDILTALMPQIKEFWILKQQQFLKQQQLLSKNKI